MSLHRPGRVTESVGHRAADSLEANSEFSSGLERALVIMQMGLACVHTQDDENRLKALAWPCAQTGAAALTIPTFAAAELPRRGKSLPAPRRRNYGRAPARASRRGRLDTSPTAHGGHAAMHL